MAHPNEQVIQRMFEAYGRGDTATLRQVLAEDVVYHLPGRTPMGGMPGVHRGPVHLR